MDYEIQASKDGKTWTHQARFKKGSPSRFGEPFDEKIAVQEAELFKIRRFNAGWIYVRLIINIDAGEYVGGCDPSNIERDAALVVFSFDDPDVKAGRRLRTGGLFERGKLNQRGLNPFQGYYDKYQLKPKDTCQTYYRKDHTKRAGYFCNQDVPNKEITRFDELKIRHLLRRTSFKPDKEYLDKEYKFLFGSTPKEEELQTKFELEYKFLFGEDAK